MVGPLGSSSIPLAAEVHLDDEELAARYEDSCNQATSSSQTFEDQVNPLAVKLSKALEAMYNDAHPFVDESIDNQEEQDDFDSDELDDWSELDSGSLKGAKGIKSLSGWHPNAQSSSINQGSLRKMQPQSNDMQKLASRVKVGPVKDSSHDCPDGGNFSMDSSVRSFIKKSTNKQMEGSARSKDKSDRATLELVLDPRTRYALFKMLNSGQFSEINGCISTGKEANVYHAVDDGGKDLAVKIYKTSILVFKDRDRYVSGDPRFKSYNKSNPRHMVKMWAEKEMRNLSRIHAAGIRCPKPVHLRMHILVMELIGTDGVAALRLKDARVPLQRLQSMYTEMIVIMRRLYQECRLVHGDLSEYNILVNEGELYLIDVSQAVDLDHPRAFDFLKEDAAHVNAFFKRSGIATLNTRELFEFVVDPNINEGNMEASLTRLSEYAASRPTDSKDEDDTADNVFAQSHIPKSLEEVEDAEQDFDRLAEGKNVEGIYYQTVTGMKQDMSGVRRGPAIAEIPKGKDAGDIKLEEGGVRANSAPASEKSVEDGESDSEAESRSDGSGSSSGDSDNDLDSVGKGQGYKTIPLNKEAEKAARKQHKREVKEFNKERRQNKKMPKHIKKAKMNKGKNKKK